MCSLSITSTIADNNQQAKAQIEKRVFGKLADGTPVDLYTLRNKNGLEVQITNYGATVVSLKTPDRQGQTTDIVLGYDDARGYENDSSYFGSIVGRYANRLAGGRFSLSGVKYQLAQNNGLNHLHGGIRGFNKVVWQAHDALLRPGDMRLELRYVSRDGEEGYPGNLSVTVTYSLTDKNELRIEYSATTDKETIVNLTHHSYFNLVGAGSGDILRHELRMNADKFVPTDATSIPTGELKSVAGTPFDFRRRTTIGSRINDQDEQLRLGKGYDHTYVLNKRRTNALSLAADVYEPVSGRMMQVWTTEPGVQLYTGNYLAGISGKGGSVYNIRDGFCLEAQHFPDSPNRPSFPTTVLKPGMRYTQTTAYRFMVIGANKRP